MRVGLRGNTGMAFRTIIKNKHVFVCTCSLDLQCSVTCGEGINTRPVECMRLATNEVVPDDMCTDPKPAETRPCPRQPVCPCELSSHFFLCLITFLKSFLCLVRSLGITSCLMEPTEYHSRSKEKTQV